MPWMPGKDLGGKLSVGIHFGTFYGLTDESIDEPSKDLRKALDFNKISRDSFVVPEFGKVESKELASISYIKQTIRSEICLLNSIGSFRG